MNDGEPAVVDAKSHVVAAEAAGNGGQDMAMERVPWPDLDGRLPLKGCSRRC